MKELDGRIERLLTENERLLAENERTSLGWVACEGKMLVAENQIAKLEAVREAAERTEAYLRLADNGGCYACASPCQDRHADDCTIPALRAALDAAKDGS